MVGTLAGAVRGLDEDSVLHAATKKVIKLHNRFFCWFSLSLLILSRFGFIVGPLMAWRELRKAERPHSQKAYAARRRDQGFTAAQWWVMTPLTVMGCSLGHLGAQRTAHVFVCAVCATDPLDLLRMQGAPHGGATASLKGKARPK